MHPVAEARSPRSPARPPSGSGHSTRCPPSNPAPQTGPGPINGPPRVAYAPLVVLLAAVLVGIGLDGATATTSASMWTFVGLVAAAAWVRADRAGRAGWGTVCLALAALAAGGAWHHLWWHTVRADDLAHFATLDPRPCAVEVCIRGAPRQLPASAGNPLDPVPRPVRTGLVVEALALRDGLTWRPVSGRAIVQIDGWLDDLGHGDRLRLRGRLARPWPAMNPGERDAAERARADRVGSRLRVDSRLCVERLERGSPWSPARWLAWARVRGDAVLARHLDREGSRLATALLLGFRERLDPEASEAFFETGTVHLLSISGLHVGLLAGFLLGVLRLGWLDRRTALATVALVTSGYALVIDAEAPAQRATVLVVLACGAWLAGRAPHGANLLAAAALVVVALNPTEALRTGTQLSFLSAATLVWFGPRWFEWTRRDRLERLIEEARPAWERRLRDLGRQAVRLVWVGAAVWLVTLPLVAHAFHVVSPATLALTPLLSLPIAVALASGFLVLVVGWLCPPLGDLLGLLCQASLGLIDRLVALGQQAPASHFWTPGPSAAWVALFYVALIAAVALPRWRPRPAWCAALLAGWFAVGFGISPRHAGRLECTFLAVGHGLGAVLELPDGRTLVYDAGHFGPPGYAAEPVAERLWSRGRRAIDGLVVSHADLDHFNGVPELLRRFEVREIVVGPGSGEPTSAPPAVAALWRAVDRAGVPRREAAAGTLLAAGDAWSVRVVQPPASAGHAGTDNARSLVLAVEHHGRRMLLTGDLEAEGLIRLLDEAPWPCDVLLAPHHGSRRSNMPALAAWCRPRWVVVSGSLPTAEACGELAATYAPLGARVLHTGQVGAVTVALEAEGVRVETFRPVADSPPAP